MGNKSKQIQKADNNPVLLQTEAQIQTTQLYSGPIPPAAEMAKYAQVREDLPNRIMTMAEEQAKHRQAIEQQDSKQRFIAMFLCSIISLIAIIGGIWCILQDKDATGLTLIISDLAILVGAFFYKRNN